MQEYYESPSENFRRRSFSRDEYKAWYRDNPRQVDYYLTCGFDYYLIWSGFNVPSWVLDALQGGHIGPLSAQEKAVLMALPQDGEHGYVIGTCEDDVETLQHEMAHGLYSTNTEYHLEVAAQIRQLPQETYASMKA